MTSIIGFTEEKFEGTKLGDEKRNSE